MRSQYYSSQSREGVELWEIGETLGGLGVPPLMTPSPIRKGPSVSSGSTISSGSSGSGSLQRPRHRVISSWRDEDLVVDPDNMSLRSHGASEERIYTNNLTRSRSFGGLGPRTRRSLPGTLRTGWTGAQGVLGQGACLSPRDLRRMSSLPPHVKVPKSPRPERACQVSTAVSRGIRDCISATRHDLLTLRKAQHDYKVAKQYKAAERYLKRLEFLLSQIEDLNDQYSLNQRLRDGVRTMAYAFALSPGKEKSAALTNVRSGYKECTDTLCSLEVQIEQIIGTLSFEMKGIQGFARLCPGDVFEVVIKHGSQKWKAKGRITKDNTQIWDNPSHVFKALIGEMLVIKAMEVRLLGKTVLIGRKVCETKELFSPHPQLMTVNLNPSGSLKLNVVITWNPLECSSDETLGRTGSLSAASPRNPRKSTLQAVHSSPPAFQRSNTYCKDETMEGDKDSSFGSMSARSSTTDGSSPMSEYRNVNRRNSNSPISEALSLSKRTDSHDSISVDGRDSASPCDDTGNFTLVRKEESKVEQWARYSLYDSDKVQDNQIPPIARPTQSLSRSIAEQLQLLTLHENDSMKPESLAWDCSIPTSLPKVINRLKNCLEDIQGQYPQLHMLEEAVLSLHDTSRHCRSRHDSNTSEISLSVESALECFDFLNAECEDDFADDNPEVCRLKNQKETIAREQAGRRKSLETPAMVSGSPEIDTFLLVHLKHSLQLLQDLGSFGPLRRKEKESLIKLEQEGKLLQKVLSHKQNFDCLKPQHIIPVPHVQVLWDTVSKGDDWCIDGKTVVDSLLTVVSSLAESEELAKQVLQEIVRQMTDSDMYSDCLTVTVGHFLDHLRKPLQESVPETQTVLKCLDLLKEGRPESIRLGLSNMKKSTLSLTKLIARHADSENAHIVSEFLRNNQQQNELISSLLDTTLLLLESAIPSDRSSACVLLGLVIPFLSNIHLDRSNDIQDKKIDSFQPILLLSFLQQNDPSEQVRNSSRRVLLEQGALGVEALKQIDLSTHGFQGLEVGE